MTFTFWQLLIVLEASDAEAEAEAANAQRKQAKHSDSNNSAAGTTQRFSGFVLRNLSPNAFTHRMKKEHNSCLISLHLAHSAKKGLALAINQTLSRPN